MKRPAFQFYPADWRKDAAVQACSMAARGLWHEMLCIMHECQPYGYLMVNDMPMQPEQIARLVGESAKDVKAWIAELEQAGVFSRGPDGAIYSRRMVKDEELRNIRAHVGRLGGNPSLVNQKDNQADNQTLNTQENRNLTPSSSSSSSSSKAKSKAKPSADFAAPPWLSPESWAAWLQVRAKKRAASTPYALTLAVKSLEELRSQGCDPQACLDQSIAKGWLTFYPPKSGSFQYVQTDRDADRKRTIDELTGRLTAAVG
jgi:hypothetical protein